MLKVFTQDRCPMCVSLKEEVNKVIDKENIKIVNMIPENKEEFKKYRILKLPVSILVDEFDEEITRFYGRKKSEDIISFIEENKY